MLTLFSVKNFRCFKDWVHLDLTTDKRYEFSEHAVKDGVIQHAMVYGPNGGGKTNLGYALLDAANHLNPSSLTGPSTEIGYLNGNSDSDSAEFHFRFLLEGHQVDYVYRKTAPNELTWEKLSFDDQVVIEWNREELTPAIINLDGTETLNKELTANIISAISYVDKNSALTDNLNTRIFTLFLLHIRGMAFLKTSHESNLHFFPSRTGVEVYAQWIVENNKVESFQRFLYEAQIDCKVGTADSFEGKKLVLQYKNTYLSFMEHASSGTISLAKLYFYLEAMRSKGYFIYIDEFDTFFHHSLAQASAKKIFESEIQVILSTHNTSIMNNDLLRPDCYFTVEQDKITPLYKQSDRELRKAHNLEKMYRAGAFSSE